MDGVIASVKRGRHPLGATEQSFDLPDDGLSMVSVGEETGALDSMLNKVAEFYEDRVDASVKALASILEPVMILFIGGIVGFVVISMYMPLFTVYEHIGN